MYNNYKFYELYKLFMLIIYIFLIYSVISWKYIVIKVSIYFSIFMILKWIFDYRKCTFGYIECKLRNVKREEGFINDFCKYYGDLIYNENNYLLFILILIIYSINLIKYIYIYKKLNI